MLIATLALLAVWALASAIAVGLCASAAAGDRTMRRRAVRRDVEAAEPKLHVAA